MGRHCLAMVRRQALRYQFHFRMTATSSSIILQLPIEISQAEPGKTRGTGAIAAPIQPMTGKAGISGPGIAPAQRNQLAIAGESIRGRTLSGRSEEHTSELQSLMRISYAVFCLTTKTRTTPTRNID